MMRFLNFFFIPMVQEYLNEISPTIYGPNKPKTSGKPLRIPDLQTPASNHYKPATLYVNLVNSDFLHIVFIRIHRQSSKEGRAEGPWCLFIDLRLKVLNSALFGFSTFALKTN